MITIDSPSMAVNDERSNRICQMDHNRVATSATSMTRMVEWIVAAANRAQNGQIRNLVLNAHGTPGQLLIGSGPNVNTMTPFQRVNGKVYKIWFRGCLACRSGARFLTSPAVR